MTEYIIRQPLPAELHRVQALRHEVLDPQRAVPSDVALGPKDFDPAYIHMAAFDEGVVVSTVRLDPLSDRWYTVRKMATKEALHGQGLGRLVLQAAEREAVGRGATAFQLDSRREAIGFYEKLGYQLTGEEVMHTDGIPNFTMRKTTQDA